VGSDSGEVADDRDRSLRERGQRALQALQHSLRASKDGGGQRLGAGVAAGRTVVRLPADGHGGKGAGAGDGAEDEGGDCAPRVALPALVARAAAHRRGVAVAGERGRSIRPGEKRERSPVQEQRVEILGGRSRRKVELRPLSRAELARQKKQLIAEAVEPITLRQYESQIQHYRDFCRKRGHFLYPASLEVVEDCTVSLMFSGYPTVAVNMWSAIAYYQQSAGFERPAKSAALKALHLKATKLAALGANKPRDIIPLECVRRFCGMKESETPRGIAAAALVTTGIRALLRCSELQRLKVEHITERDGMLLIDMGVRKNHKQRAAGIYLDPSKTGSLTCPVYWMKRHLAQRRADGAKGKDYVFPAARGGKASPAVISSLLDMVVRGAPECRDLNISTHSLRISGAVFLMMAGFSATEIQIMGDWKSDVYLRYLRTLGLAVKQASTGMGL
jgi:site-specific recombinase XerD